MTRRASFTLTVLACMTGCAGTEVTTEKVGPQTSTEGRYPLALFRAFEAGDRFSLYSGLKHRQDDVLTHLGKVVSRQETVSQVGLEATATVQTTSNGDGQVLRLHIERFEIDGEQALSPGQIVVVDTARTPKLSFEGGVQPTEGVIEALKSRLEMKPTKNDAELFGDATPHKPGESWMLDSDALAQAINKAGVIVVNASAVTGDTTFVGIESLDGQDCTLTESNLEITAVEMVKPPKYRLDRGHMHTDFDVLVPVDPEVRDRRSVKSETTVHVSMTGTAPNGVTVPGTSISVTTQILTIHPVDAPAEG